MIDKKLYVGKTVMVFDSNLWRKNGGDSESDTFMRKATITDLYSETDYYEAAVKDYAEIRFEHDGRISRGHFTNAIEEYHENHSK